MGISGAWWGECALHNSTTLNAYIIFVASPSFSTPAPVQCRQHHHPSCFTPSAQVVPVHLFSEASDYFNKPDYFNNNITATWLNLNGPPPRYLLCCSFNPVFGLEGLRYASLRYASLSRTPFHDDDVDDQDLGKTAK